MSAADLPMSILIVGVGDADFALMEQLDGDEVRLSHNVRGAPLAFVSCNQSPPPTHRATCLAWRLTDLPSPLHLT